MRLVWAADIRPAAKKLVVLRIADRCDDEGGSFFMSLSTVARDAGLSQSQTQRIFRTLRSEAILLIEAREPGRVPRYRLNLELLSDMAGCDAGAGVPMPGGSAGAVGGAAPMLPVGGSAGAVGGAAPMLPGGSAGAVGGAAPMLPGGSTHAARSTHTHQLTPTEPAGAGRVDKQQTTPADAEDAMRAEGLSKASRESKALIALVQRGATRDMFQAAARAAMERGAAVRDPVAYALDQVKRQADNAAQTRPMPVPALVLRPPLSDEELRLNGERARQAAAVLGIPVRERRGAAAPPLRVGAAGVAQ